MHTLRTTLAVVVAVSALPLSAVGAGFARPSTPARTSVVMVTDGKIKPASGTLLAGIVTFVAHNMGRNTHALAIKGPGLSGKRTPVIEPGQTARLTVTLKKGMFMLWDPLRGGMSRSVMLMVGGGM